MGVIRAGNLETVGQSNAQVIGGGLRFDSGKKTYLTRTPGSAGNRTTWTWSGWVKRTRLGNGSSQSATIFVASDYTANTTQFYFEADNTLYFYDYQSASYIANLRTTQVFRDVSAWAHFMVVFDSNNGTSGDRVRIYVNGSRITNFSTATYPNSGATTRWNNTVANEIASSSNSYATDIMLSNCYFIDGQALDSSYFGYTDALTNTWRPKKLSSSVVFGTNGFYLPFDGSAPIGQDQSGNGNNWTPVNFGGSNTIEKATGALPILNTDGGGKVARVGVRTDANANSLVLALPLVGIKSDFSNQINGGTSNKAITATNATGITTASNFYGGSFRFPGNASLTSPSNADFALGTGDFTIEFWAYPTAYSTYDPYIITNVTNGFYIGKVDTVFALRAFNVGNLVTTTTFPPLNSWTHIAVTRQGTTARIFYNGVLIASGTTSQDFLQGELRIGDDGGGGGASYINSFIQDVRIYKGVAKYTSNFIPASTDPDIVPDSPSGVSYSSNVALVPSTDGAVAFDGSGDYLSLASSADFAFGTDDFTIEAFCYRQSGKFFTMFDHLMGAGNFTIFSYADDVIQVYNNAFLSSGVNPGNNKWFHLAVVRQSGVLSFYIDGIKASTTHSFTFNFTTAGVNIGVTQYTEYSTGLISNLHVVKGTALYTSNFTPPSAPISSVENTKLLCCKSNSSVTAADVTPGTITANGNAAATNFNPFTANINTQRGKSSGYCTLNPLQNTNSDTFSNGNLQVSTNFSNYGTHTSTIATPLSGKWYAEVTVGSASSYSVIGLVSTTSNFTTTSWPGSLNGVSYYGLNGYKIVDTTASSYGSTFGNGDVIGIAYDADSGSVTFYKNGVSQGTITSVTVRSYYFAGSDYDGSGSVTYYWNFGQKPFKFPPPPGFQPLTLANLPRPTIVRPDQYVGIVTYTGNDATQTVSGLGFKPDFLWLKSRNNSFYHRLYDSIRGVTKALYSNATDTEGAYQTTYENLTSFDRNGFTLGTVTIEDGINKSNSTMVAWAWKAGGNSNTYNIDDVGYATASAAGLTAGTITPTGASVNTKSGFSIITWTGNGVAGASVSHGLGTSPSLIITKDLDATKNWNTYHKSLGATNIVLLNSTNAAAAGDNYYDTTPTSTVFYNHAGNPSFGSQQNIDGNRYVSYSWAEIPGFSKFGSYTGNGNADGPAIITGFRPRWIMVKGATFTSNWNIYDSVRDPFNIVDNTLRANLSNAEITSDGAGEFALIFDFLSNGFKVRYSGADINSNGQTFIYAAFAEAPAINLYGAQANAR